MPPVHIDPSTFLYEHCALPALPSVLTRFQEAILAEDVSIGAITRIISSDPAIVAEILKVINSAYYSLPREVTRIDIAVAYLGIHEVHNVVLTASVYNALGSEHAADFKALWFHSFYTALCARFLAHRFERHLSYSELWAPALLHDIGKIIYLKFFPEHFRAILQYTEKHECMHSEAEHALGLPTSAYLGGLLCDRWRLPREVKTVCTQQGVDVLREAGSGEALGPLHRLVVLGDLMAVLATTTLNDEARLEVTGLLRENLDLTEDDFLLLMGSIVDLKEEAERLAI